MSASDLKPSRAIIDIGSNTVRLVIYGGPPRAPVVLLNEKVTAKLGKGVAEDGLLGRKAQDAALRALARFARLVRLKGLTRIDTVATAAVRDARNGAEFLAEVSALGLAPRLLSGDEEARTSASGVLGAFPGARGIVADLGGGSIELIEIANGACLSGVTLPLGTLMLPALRAGGNRPFNRAVAKVFDAADWRPGTADTLYLVGGSLRAFARYAMQREHWVLEDPHGFTLDAASAERIAVRLSAQRGVELGVAGLSASRAAMLPDTALLLRTLIRKVRPERLIFSSWGLREGIVYRSLSPAAQAQDPLVAGVAAFAGRHGVATPVAVMVAGWCAAAAGNASAGRENIVLAATMLALASGRVEPNLRADHAVDWALRKRWIGLEAADRALIAVCLLANAGRLAVPPALAALASPALLHEAQGWGLALRLCRRFSDCTVEALGASSLGLAAGSVTLTVGQSFADLVNADVERDLNLLASHFGLAPVMVFARA
jgi:exopolyphosphatase / guanosine-5'-triphosphate,3'-diphosphate pyrophosphatase